jgi:hypothetical protein
VVHKKFTIEITGWRLNLLIGPSEMLRKLEGARGLGFQHHCRVGRALIDIDQEYSLIVIVSCELTRLFIGSRLQLPKCLTYAWICPSY